MGRVTNTEHPDLETLASFADGCSEGAGAEQVQRHLDSCPLCRLEVKRISRFQRIGSDRELAEKADWSGARFKLERAFNEQILPAVAGKKKRDPGISGRWSSFVWLAPLAAAAAVLVIFVAVERMDIPITPPSGLGPMRGEPAVEYGIVLEDPLGEIAETPGAFSWRSSREDEYYSLEIFTVDLRRIYRADNLTGNTWAVPDTLAKILVQDSIYLWKVKGYKGLEEEALSPNGWFKFSGQ